MSSQLLTPLGAEAVADPEVGRDDADPAVFAEIELHLVGLHDGLGDQAGIEDGHGGAVLGRRHVEIAHRGQAAGARHVLDDDVGIAGDVADEMARQRSGIDVIAAARREADHDGEGLALVEIIGAPMRRQRQRSDQHRRKTKRPALEHRYPYRRLLRPRCGDRYYRASWRRLLRQNAADLKQNQSVALLFDCLEAAIDAW